ncbi:MAG: cation:proton antiporter, partial [Rhodospirillales bacterium]|nr:cation:proton antiporter [Rhodospirillales bacterium]
MEIIAQLVVLLLLTRLFGEIAARLGLAVTVGELTAGVMIAAVVAGFGTTLPVLGPLLSGIATSDTLRLISNAAIFFLVLMAGIEMRPGEVAQHSGASFMVALGGVLLPLSAGFWLAWTFLPDSDARQAQALLVGVVMSITSIPATAKIFNELNLIHTKVGQTVIYAAIFDDVIGVFLLAVLTAVIETGHIPDLTSFALLLLKIGMFFAVVIGLGVHVYPRVSRRLQALQTASAEFSILMAVALCYALLAEALGMHWILGAFAAGLFFEPARVGAFAYTEMKMIVTGVTVGFFGPIFFASIGLRVDLTAIGAVPWFVAALIVVAFAGKLLGAGVPARWTGLGTRASVVVGVGMSTRG